jgi:hypothetical protein
VAPAALGAILSSSAPQPDRIYRGWRKFNEIAKGAPGQRLCHGARQRRLRRTEHASDLAMTNITLLNAQYYNTPDNVGPVVMDAGVANTTLNVTLTIDYLPPPTDPNKDIIYVYLILSPERGPDRPYRDDLQYWQGTAGTVTFTWKNVPSGTWYIDLHCYHSPKLTNVPDGSPPEGDALSVPNVTGHITVVSSA